MRAVGIKVVMVTKDMLSGKTESHVMFEKVDPEGLNLEISSETERPTRQENPWAAPEDTRRVQTGPVVFQLKVEDHSNTRKALNDVLPSVTEAREALCKTIDDKEVIEINEQGILTRKVQQP